jgi:hypothetical protein
MEDRADQERDKHGHGLGKVRAGWEVDMAEEEVVNGDIPLSRELEPDVDVSLVRMGCVDLGQC